MQSVDMVYGIGNLPEYQIVNEADLTNPRIIPANVPVGTRVWLEGNQPIYFRKKLNGAFDKINLCCGGGGGEIPECVCEELTSTAELLQEISDLL